jgi:hypothetical protein
MAGQVNDITLRHIPRQRLDRVSESGTVMNPPVFFSSAAAVDFRISWFHPMSESDFARKSA